MKLDYTDKIILVYRSQSRLHQDTTTTTKEKKLKIKTSGKSKIYAN